MASVAEIDGLTIASAPAFTGLLDTYTGAAAGYSVRQLKSGVTVAMRVRRNTAGTTGDNDEADIAFDTSLTDPAISLDSAISNASVGVTATTLGEFINVGTVGGTTYSNPDSLSVTASCFVDEWKDQSGNANHASQAVFGSQPQIHSGTVNTDLITENGKPAIDFAADELQVANSTILNATDVSLFATVTITSTNRGQIVSNGDNANAKDRFYMYENAALLVGWSGNNTGSLATYTTSNQILADYFVTGFETSGTAAVDTHVNGGLASSWTYSSGVAPQTMTGGSNPLTIGAHFLSSETQFFNGTMQEIVIYHFDQTSPTNNRTGIETNVNDYFSIY